MNFADDDFADPRAEFADSSNERNLTEHPENAYLRGYQQGAHALRVALQNVLDPGIMKQIDEFVDITIANWRYGKRRFKRELSRDRAARHGERIPSSSTRRGDNVLDTKEYTMNMLIIISPGPPPRASAKMPEY